MRSNLMKRTFATAGILSLLTPSIASSAPSAISPLLPQSCLASKAQELQFSGVVSIMRSGVATSYAQGQVSGPGTPPISFGTQFNLGSAGKMFTAVAIAQLLEAGKIALEDPIGKYVKGLTAQASEVSVRQLLNHTSGLGNYFAPENLPALTKAKTLKDLFPLVANDVPEFAPGSRFSYSDSGFLLLGLLVECVSGLSYGDYIHSHVFMPAKMLATGFEPRAVPARAEGMTHMPSPANTPMAAMRHGQGLRLDAPPTPSPEALQEQPPHMAETKTPPSNGPHLLLRAGDSRVEGPLRQAQEAALQGGPAGGVYSTADDMQKFFSALQHDKLIHEDTVKMLTSPQITASQAKNIPPDRSYGLGFGVGLFRGHRWFGHNGGAPGVNTETFVFPEDQVSIVVLSNRDPPTASILFQQIRADLFTPESACAGPN